MDATTTALLNTLSAPVVMVLSLIILGILIALGLEGVVERAHQIPPEVAGISSFALAFAGMVVGSLLAPSKK